MDACKSLALSITLAIGLGACSTPLEQLSQLPQYDSDAATEHWGILPQLDITQHRLSRLAEQVERTPDEDATLNVHLDRFLYYYAVTTIALFHADYVKMDAAVEQAKAALRAQYKLLMKDVDNPTVSGQSL